LRQDIRSIHQGRGNTSCTVKNETELDIALQNKITSDDSHMDVSGYQCVLDVFDVIFYTFEEYIYIYDVIYRLSNSDN
jgi:hypothetical protein